MQFGTWPLADPNPAISPFVLQPSVVQGLSSFVAFVEETVQTEYPAPVISGASFWDYPENLWHCGLLLQMVDLLSEVVNEAAHFIYGPPR